MPKKSRRAARFSARTSTESSFLADFKVARARKKPLPLMPCRMFEYVSRNWLGLAKTRPAKKRFRPTFLKGNNVKWLRSAPFFFYLSSNSFLLLLSSASDYVGADRAPARPLFLTKRRGFTSLLRDADRSVHNDNQTRRTRVSSSMKFYERSRGRDVDRRLFARFRKPPSRRRRDFDLGPASARMRSRVGRLLCYSRGESTGEANETIPRPTTHHRPTYPGKSSRCDISRCNIPLRGLFPSLVEGNARSRFSTSAGEAAIAFLDTRLQYPMLMSARASFASIKPRVRRSRTPLWIY